MAPITLPYVESLISAFLAGTFHDLLAHLADDATWTIANSAYDNNDAAKGHGIFGTRSKADFIKFMNERYFPIYAGPAKLEVDSITVTGNRAAIEVHVVGPLKSGKTFDNRYAWFMEFDEETRKIVAVRDYLDTLLVYEAITENELASSQAERCSA